MHYDDAAYWLADWMQDIIEAASPDDGTAGRIAAACDVLMAYKNRW
jgi:hypothetical protein